MDDQCNRWNQHSLFLIDCHLMIPIFSTDSLVYQWLWSTVFHARDCLLTERLDYFCASLGISYALATVLIRWMNLVSLRKQLLVLVPLGLLFLSHISYLHFVHFDYGWNMAVRTDALLVLRP